MNGPPKRKPPGGTGGGRKSTGSFGGQSRQKNTESAREFQGMAGNRRHATQRPPRWNVPAGAAGLAALEALWGPPKRPLPRRQR
jgi:hypothetical protein